ncbi:aminotransferase class III-fold pyridoxal phosphate-dependent enzyme [Parahaliea maris]|uniref:Aminotransferase class III-fold pyridoxal phosphate-dependent enzyme n=1 Tax=Parahaliea maris TaxID=2716870 RepID=A0A5C8ZTP8_9GAMM|nr:aminotransferase [Parahaliea maris]TXS91845.1 aminotransferase class III-fold pyridoxal phosphate-dependent enzyme [Parahaliea maris]
MTSNTSTAQQRLIDADHAHLLHPFSSLYSQKNKELAFFESGEGIWLTSASGEKYIDAAGGLWCTNVGYGRQELVDAASSQMSKLCYLHSFSNFTHEPQIELTEKLLSLLPSGFDRIFYGLSGSDANDSNVKLIWRYNNVLGRPEKKKIIARESGYHGSTVTAGSLTGITAAHRAFDIPRPGFLHTVAADWHRRPDHIATEEEFVRYLADELEKLILAEGPDTIAAFFAEPISGSGGIIPPPAGYFEAIDAVLKRYDILMVADEVITGFGRTGTWFASPRYNIKPDLMTLSKGITSGYLPLSASVLSERVSKVLYSEAEADGAFGHGFTASGHPVCTAVAMANIDILEREKLPENAAKVGAYLQNQLREQLGDRPFVSDIRGEGLLMTIEFDKDKETRTPFVQASKAGHFAIQACHDEKLVIRGARGRALAAMAPPLTLTESEADQIVERLLRAFTRIEDAMHKGEFD